ncbi:MAG: ricin-type beta-trefoil lectin domain protein [Saprospiraceae bacterium]
MKKQTFNFKSLLLLTCMAVLFFGFAASEAMATAPTYALKGALPVPGTSHTSGYLTRSQHGTILENDNVTLVWENNGNLVLYWCNLETLWETNTGSNGNILDFNSGRLAIKNQSGNVIWSTSIDGGAKLELQDNRNLVMLNGSNSILWQTHTDFQQDMNTNGVQTLGFKSDDDLVYDLRVPKSTTSGYLYIHAEGADGGKRQVKEAWGATRFTVNGGAGASIAGVFEIGTGANQIPPGSSVRVIVGEKGVTMTDQATTACDGGGGTGVLFKRPNDPEWHLLVVAGGGGGAYSDCCTAKSEGKSAEITEDGGDGACPTCNNNGGTNGDGGTGVAEANVAGMGIKWFAVNAEGAGFTAWLEQDEDRTRLPTGSSDLISAGFGGGGVGGPFFSGGGGGGGYSGGGDGICYYGGGGGGSYLNSDMAIDSYKIKNPSTSDTQDGFVRYEFVSSSQLVKQIKFDYNHGFCIDDYGSLINNGTNIQTYRCQSYNNQKWYFHPTDRTIRSALDFNKCLDLDNSNTANGANIQLYDCNGANAQHWVYNGLYKTMHSGVNSDKCFYAPDGSIMPSVNLQLWDCNYSNINQKWKIDGAVTVSDLSNMKHILPVLATSFAVHSHTGAESGSNIQLWTKDNINTAEQWYFDGLAIKMRDHQNLCIDLSQSNNIQLYDCNGTNAQKWLYDGMNRSIRSVVNPDKCMQIDKNTDGAYGKRSNVSIYDCNGSQEQQFLIQE